MARQHSPTDDLQELRAVLGAPGLSAHERLVMVSLGLHRNGQTGRCDPSVDRMVEQTGVSRWSVMRAIKALETRGRLRCERRNGARTSYTIHAATRGTQLPVAVSDRLRTATKPVAHSYTTSSTLLPERTKNERERTKDVGEASPANDRRDFPPPSKLPRRGRDYIYPPEFEGAFSALPHRHVVHPKFAAYKAWQARVEDVDEVFQLEAAADAYREDCERQQRVGTEYVMQASTFFGPDERWTPYSAVERGSLHTQTGQAPTTDPLLMTSAELLEQETQDLGAPSARRTG